MKKLINRPEDVVDDALHGLLRAHPHLLKVSFDPVFVMRADAPIAGKVGIVSGGGSGHEPMHSGFVGHGMLDAACPGAVFTSPTPDQMLAATRAVDGTSFGGVMREVEENLSALNLSTGACDGDPTANPALLRIVLLRMVL